MISVLDTPNQVSKMGDRTFLQWIRDKFGVWAPIGSAALSLGGCAFNQQPLVQHAEPQPLRNFRHGTEYINRVWDAFQDKSAGLEFKLMPEYEGFEGHRDFNFYYGAELIDGRYRTSIEYRTVNPGFEDPEFEHFSIRLQYQEFVHGFLVQAGRSQWRTTEIHGKFRTPDSEPIIKKIEEQVYPRKNTPERERFSTLLHEVPEGFYIDVLTPQAISRYSFFIPGETIPGPYKQFTKGVVQKINENWTDSVVP